MALPYNTTTFFVIFSTFFQAGILRSYLLLNWAEVSFTPCKISINSREDISAFPPLGRSKVPDSKRLLYKAYPSRSHWSKRN